MGSESGASFQEYTKKSGSSEKVFFGAGVIKETGDSSQDSIDAIIAMILDTRLKTVSQKR